MANILVRRNGAVGHVVFSNVKNFNAMTTQMWHDVPARIQHGVPVPVVDCIAAGIRQAELLVRMNLPKPTTGSYALPSGRELVNVDDAVRSAFGPQDGDRGN